MKLRLVIGVLGNRVRAGADHERHVPSEELRLYVGQSGLLMALTPAQVESLTAEADDKQPEDKQPAEPAANPDQQELPTGYQQAPKQ